MLCIHSLAPPDQQWNQRLECGISREWRGRPEGLGGRLVDGATDGIGHKGAQDRVGVHGFHATLLHLLGVNSRGLIVERNGLSEWLTDQFPE